MIERLRYRWKVLTSLYLYTNGVRKFWVILLLFSFISASLKFVEPALYKLFINQVILLGELDKLRIVVIGYLLVFAGNFLVNYVMLSAKYRFLNHVLYRIREKILQELLEKPFADYENNSIGDAKMRLDDDTEPIKEFADNQTINYLMALITIVVCMWILLSINLILAIIGFAAIPLTLWIENKLSKQEKCITEKRRENLQEMSTWLHASVQGWREIKALNLSKHEAGRYYYYLHREMLHFAKWINYWTARVLVIPKVKNECLLQFGLYLFGGLLIMSGKMTIGDLLVFAMYYTMLSGAVQTGAGADAQLQAQAPYINRIIEGLTQRKERGKSKIYPENLQDIEFRRVSFHYPKTDEKILENFNLFIGRGERLAIVGKSGSGKTTLLKLLTGMLDPTEGQITFSGIDLQDIDLTAMHQKMGFVMQSNILFHTSIRENLYYGKKNATEEELTEACKKACILEFIQESPKGFDTILGEKGINLSGGQRQRIILARMFLQNADIFIFDEATSALDQYSESIVHDAINNVSQDKTIIVVSHRESSIQLCNRVIRIGE